MIFTERLGVEEYDNKSINSTLKDKFQNKTHTDLETCMNDVNVDRKLVAVEYSSFPNGTDKCTLYRAKVQDFPITLDFVHNSDASVLFVVYPGVGDEGKQQRYQFT